MSTNPIAMIMMFVTILIILNLGLFVFASMLNQVFFGLSIRNVLLFSLGFSAIYVALLALCMAVGGDFLMAVFRVITYYLGFLLYAFFAGVIFRALYGLGKIFHIEHILAGRIVGIILVSLWTATIGRATYNYHKGISVQEFTLTSTKVTRPYTIVQIGDTQLGSTTKRHFEKTIDLAMQQNPDFIVFVGDLVDSDHYKLSDLDALNSLSVPLYFISGNHEYYHKIDRISEYVGSFPNVVHLINNKAAFEEVEIVGIDYGASENMRSVAKNHLQNKLDDIHMDNNKFSVLLYHEPKDVHVAIQKGFDLSLHGHTHGGQMFPLNYIIQKIYPYGQGFHKVQDTTIYTTNGAGLWGPRMRLGSQNEIAVFTIVPQE